MSKETNDGYKTRYQTDINSGLDIRRTDNSPKEKDAMVKKHQVTRTLTEEEVQNLIQDMQS